MFCFRLTQKDEDGARVHHARGGQNRSKTTAAPLQHCHSYSLATLLTPHPSRAQTAATRGGGAETWYRTAEIRFRGHPGGRHMDAAQRAEGKPLLRNAVQSPPARLPVRRANA
ncbi:hypothetical protein BHM03_00022853 [Ensete ventricosum]|nr:hypothetical protein BHM03_00022853 [Ensete ventricosum]